MKKNIIGLIIVLVIIVAAGGYLLWSEMRSRNAADYYPRVNAKDFGAALDNPYFTLKPKTTYLYERETAEGTERTAIWLTDEMRVFMGVTARGVIQRTYLDNLLKEEAKDWYAQDRSENVWRFGRNVEKIGLEQEPSRNGSWEAGANDAQPGLIMKGNPQAGNTYREGYREGLVEDMGEVIAVEQEVTVPLGTYTQCIKTRNWSAIDQQRNDYSLYCRDVGFLAQIHATGVETDQASLVGMVPQ